MIHKTTGVKRMSVNTHIMCDINMVNDLGREYIKEQMAQILNELKIKLEKEWHRKKGVS